MTVTEAGSIPASVMLNKRDKGGQKSCNDEAIRRGRCVPDMTRSFDPIHRRLPCLAGVIDMINQEVEVVSIP